jgi:hypothetical protein
MVTQAENSHVLERTKNGLTLVKNDTPYLKYRLDVAR